MAICGWVEVLSSGDSKFGIGECASGIGGSKSSIGKGVSGREYREGGIGSGGSKFDIRECASGSVHREVGVARLTLG